MLQHRPGCWHYATDLRKFSVLLCMERYLQFQGPGKSRSSMLRYCSCTLIRCDNTWTSEEAIWGCCPGWCVTGNWLSYSASISESLVYCIRSGLQLNGERCSPGTQTTGSQYIFVFSFFHDEPRFIREGWGAVESLPLSDAKRKTFQTCFNSQNEQCWHRNLIFFPTWSCVQRFPIRVSLITEVGFIRSCLPCVWLVGGQD